MNFIRHNQKMNILHLFRRYREISVPVRSILILMFMLLFLAAGYLILFVRINRIRIDRDTEELYGKSADHYITSVSEKLKSYLTSMGIIALNQTIRENIFRTDVNKSQMVTVSRNLDSRIDEMTYFLYRNNDVFQHNLYTYLPADGWHFLNIEDAKKQSWYREVQKKSPCWQYVYSKTIKSNLLVLASKINAFGSDSLKPEEYCYQTVKVDTSVLFSPTSFGFQGENTAVFVFNNSDGGIIYNSNTALIKSVSDLYFQSKSVFTGENRDLSINISLRTEDGKSWAVFARPLDEIGATALFLYQPVAAPSGAGRMEGVILETVGGILVAFLVVILFFYWIFTKRINNLISKMDRFNEQSCVIEKSDIGGNDEISRLDRHLNRMQNRIHILIQKKYAAELEKMKAQNEALIACINPHFLYNTLNSISAMACMEGADRADDMICSLSSIFQYSSDIKENFVYLRREIGNIQNYLHLQSIRFGDSFQYQIDIDPALEKMKVPKQILQPVVENVFKHAFRNIDRKGELQIKAEKKENYFILNVRDNGKGIESVALESLNRSFQNPGGSSLIRNNGTARIGLWNVNHRIRLIYGKSCGLNISSVEGKFTCVTIKMLCSPSKIQDDKSKMPS